MILLSPEELFKIFKLGEHNKEGLFEIRSEKLEAIR
jgi:hypothetical protein